MEAPNAEQIKYNYELRLLGKMQELIEKRVNFGVSQSQMAQRTGKSLRSIQRFENYDSLDAFLVYAYNQILN